ncbi:MAG: T9SS C-terminal target domain-containing protein, partial [Calditrichaeota bacterium]
NYGWNIMEGNECFNPSTGCDTTGLELPIWQYDHGVGRSITGGYVYRGKSVPELQGAYIYADFITGKIWALRYDKTGPPQNELLLDTHLNISSFGTDQDQELYLCAFDGKIYRFKPAVTGIMQEDLLPKKFKLLGNYPNPFNPQTTIQFQTQADALIRLDIFDVNGRLVRNLVRQFLPEGTHSATWDGRDQRGQPQPSGLYFYRLQMSGAASLVRRMVLLR